MKFQQKFLTFSNTLRIKIRVVAMARKIVFPRFSFSTFRLLKFDREIKRYGYVAISIYFVCPAISCTFK